MGASMQPQPESGLFKAGRILLLVGAILHVVSAVFLVVGGVALLAAGAFVEAAGQEVGSGGAAAFIGVTYIVLGVLAVGGTVFGFLAYGRAKRNEARGAFTFGLVASLLPPLSVLLLLGAIFCKVSPEAQRQTQGFVAQA